MTNKADSGMGSIIINGHETALNGDPEKTLIEYADEMKVRVPNSCDRYGTCHECIVEIKEGQDALSARTSEEKFLRGDFRLACQCSVTKHDARIVAGTLKRGRPQILEGGTKLQVELAPMALRKGDRVFYGDEDIDQYRGAVYGIAADVGTTTVVMNLVNLETGEIVVRSAFENPQIFGGSDVMHRIRYDNEVGGHELHNLLSAYMNNAIDDMPVGREEIYEIVIAGNATMRDLLFDLDVQTIGEKPFKSRVQLEMEEGRRSTTALFTNAKDTGIRINPNGRAYGLPLIGCHVGADAAACLISSGIHRREEISLVIDIGTNTELILGNRFRILAASCPAGPAFEGGSLRCGMPGLEGAIETVSIEGGRINYDVIGGTAPQGICGSGLIDILAELLRTGKMDIMGRFTGEYREKPFPIVPEHDLYFHEHDVSVLAQAKAANYAGQKILMDRFGISRDDVHAYYLAGGFANYINPRNALAIGMILNVPEDRIVKIGNAAAEGATAVLLSRHARTELEETVNRIEHVELEMDPQFFDIFVEGCMFSTLE